MVELESRIPLRVSNRKAYVWDVDDIATLRSKHHICGILAGTLPHLSQQNVFLGVPLLLMAEEVAFLVESELAVLVDDSAAHHDPSTSSMRRWNSQRVDDMKHQISLAQEKEVKEAETSGRAMSENAIRKRKERESRRAQGKANTSETPDPTDISLFNTPSDEPSPQDVSAPQPQNLASSSGTPYAVQVPGPSSSLEWYASSEHFYPTLFAAREAGIWEYPSTLAERARCGVFRGLLEQGYFMGGGIKFGGDFLVYPGDPLRYHSHFVATVIESPTAVLRPMEIVAHGRLGTGTKKAHLLCQWDDEKKEVEFFSIEWAGFG